MSIQEEAERLRKKLKEIEATEVRIALFGQPGAGKSSLINALCGSTLAEVGVHTDTTTKAETYPHNGLIFVDLPGFDTKRFPKESYWKQFQIDTFDLFLCVFAGKFHAADVELFKALHQAGKVVVFVSNKHDQLWQPPLSVEDLEREVVKDIRRQIGDENAELFFTSCKTKAGLDLLRDAILAHLDAAKAERWSRSAAAFTEQHLKTKFKSCEDEINVAAGLAAANAFNPVPGLDISIDLGILGGLITRVRKNYHLTDQRLSMVEALPTLAPVARELSSFATKEGLLLLLKRFAGRETLKEVSKWIPLVGQTIAALAGFALTKSAGSYYNERCYKVAKAILEIELRQGES